MMKMESWLRSGGIMKIGVLLVRDGVRRMLELGIKLLRSMSVYSRVKMRNTGSSSVLGLWSVRNTKLADSVSSLTLIVIDNWRVMHGRSPFTGSRRMCGAYVGADDWRSRRTAIRQELSSDKGDDWSVGW